MAIIGNLSTAHLRIARPTDELHSVTRFYRDGLGFEVIAQFQDHEGFDGVMLGHPSAAYHLEFTRKRGSHSGSAPSEEHLLVFYLPLKAEWEEAVTRIEALGHRPVVPFNPYWAKLGRSYEDPDGYRVVLHCSGWPVK